MENKNVAIAVVAIIIVVVGLALWGHKEMSEPSRAPLEHGSVTLPATGVPPMWVHNRSAGGSVAPLPSNAAPAHASGAPAAMNEFVKEHPEQAQKIMQAHQGQQ